MDYIIIGIQEWFEASRYSLYIDVANGITPSEGVIFWQSYRTFWTNSDVDMFEFYLSSSFARALYDDVSMLRSDTLHRASTNTSVSYE